MFSWYTFKTLFDLNRCFVCSNFPLLNIMQRTGFCWLFIFIQICHVSNKQHCDNSHICEYTNNEILLNQILFK